MAMHHITKDGYSTVLKTSVEHSPEFWRMIDQLFALDALIDVRDPADVAGVGEFALASVFARDAIADYAQSISPGCAGNLASALRAHLERIQQDADEAVELERVA
jgi:hypothetical protein